MNSEVTEYISSFSDDTQSLLSVLRSLILSLAPAAEESISYKMPTYHWYGSLVRFGGFENHIGFYPKPSAIEKFKSELVDYKSSKGAIQFPIDKSLPLDLIEQIVRFRMKENRSKF